MDISGKTAIVTGGARGIGAAIVKRLTEYGAQVAIADINGDAAEATAREISAAGAEAIGVQVDVTSSASVEAMVKAVLRRFGKIDILVNNAGIGNFTPLPEVTEEDWNRVIAVNLTGAQLCSKAVFAHMMERKAGKIVYIASMGGQVGGLKVSPDYVASKAGIIGLAKSYARYGAKYGINANAVSPGPTETEMAGDRFDPASAPLGRLGKPEDIAWAVFFFASPMSDYITGATLDVNGGMLMR